MLFYCLPIANTSRHTLHFVLGLQQVESGVYPFNKICDTPQMFWHRNGMVLNNRHRTKNLRRDQNQVKWQQQHSPKTATHTHNLSFIRSIILCVYYGFEYAVQHQREYCFSMDERGQFCNSVALRAPSTTRWTRLCVCVCGRERETERESVCLWCIAMSKQQQCILLWIHL